jgi:hypothetical protein
MPEIIGKVNPDAELSPSILGIEQLSELDRATADCVAVQGMGRIFEELKLAGGGTASGSHLVEFEDGRRVAVPYFVYIGNESREE